MSQIPFCGPSYQGRSLNVNASRCVNFFPELTGAQDDKAKLILASCPGTLIKGAAGTEPTEMRGIYSFGGKLFAIAYNKFYLMDTTATPWTSTAKGTLNTTSGKISMADNGLSAAGIGGNQIIMVDGVNGYIYNISTDTFTVITDADFISNPTQVAYLDGYFVIVNQTLKFVVSDLFDGLTYNGLATAAVAAFPDPIQAVVNHNQQLFFVKQYTTEAWYDTGTPTSEGSPFSRVSGAVFDYGTPSPWSVAKGGSSIFFLANTRVGETGSFLAVVQVDANVPSVISTAPVSYRISQSTELSQVFAFCYGEQSHMFYVLTNAVDNWTFVYDVSTQMWHERSSFDTGIPIRYMANCYAFHKGKHYFGEYRGPYIAELSTEYGNDTGTPITSFRTTPHIYDNESLKPLFISRLDVDMEAGIGVDPATAYNNLAFVADGELNAWVDTNYEYAGDNTRPPEVDIAFYAEGAVVANGIFPAGAVVLAEKETTVTLSWSDDGGHVYSNEYPASLGQFNEFTKRLVWRRLGMSRARVWKLKSTSVNRKVVIGAYARVGR